MIYFFQMGLVQPPTRLGGGFKHFLFSPLFGEDEPILTNIFQLGWFNHQLENPVTQERITVPLCCVMRAFLDAWRGSRHGCDHRWGFEAWGVEALKLATVLKHI